MSEIAGMPGRTVQVRLGAAEKGGAEARPKPQADAKADRAGSDAPRSVAPYGFGFALSRGVPLAVHVAREEWTPQPGRRIPLWAVVLDRRPVTRSVCGELLTQRTQAPRYDLLEDYCPACIRQISSPGSFMRLG